MTTTQLMTTADAPPSPAPRSSLPSNAPQPPKPIPGRRWYALAAGLLVLGLAVFAYTLFDGLAQVRGFNHSLQRLVVPGGGTVQLDEPGHYTVFYEPLSRIQGQRFNTPRPMPAMALAITRQSTGQPVAIKPTASSEVYQFNTHRGYAKWQFNIDHPGTYHVDAQHAAKNPAGISANALVATASTLPNANASATPAPAPPAHAPTLTRSPQPRSDRDPDLVLAIGQLGVYSLLMSPLGILGGAATTTLALIAALILTLITAIRRHRTTTNPHRPHHPFLPTHT